MKIKYKGFSISQCVIKSCLNFFLLFVIIGIAYPYAVTYSAKLLFNENAQGSLIKDDFGKIIGSKIIGQDFSFDKTLFQSRPSASNYDPMSSGGTNYSIANKKQIEAIKERKDALVELYNNKQLIPTDMLTASASGLDPHISIENAYYQAPYIAKARNIKLFDLYELIKKHSYAHMLSNKYYVNVLELNLDLMKLNKE